MDTAKKAVEDEKKKVEAEKKNVEAAKKSAQTASTAAAGANKGKETDAAKAALEKDVAAKAKEL